MKKLLFIAGVAAACTAFAENETVTGTTEVGMVMVNNSSSTDCIVAVPFTELTGGDICVSNIVKTANLAVNDELYVYESGSWTAWVLKEGTSGAKYWQSVGVASIGADGNPKAGTSATPNAKTLVTGSAIWLKRTNPSGPFYLYGGYKQALSTEVTANVYNLIANPTDAAFELAGVTKGDMVLKVNGATSTTRYRYNGTNWGYMDSSGAMVVVGSVLSIPAGEGVWLCPKVARTINWRN